MLHNLLEEGWLTVLLAGAILVGAIFAAGLGGWRMGLKVVGCGLLAPWLIWMGLVAWCWIAEGPGHCGFAVGGGVVMVGLAGSFFWLVFAVPGLLIGLFGHWALHRITRRT